MRAWIPDSETLKTVVELPAIFTNGFQAQRFFCSHFGDIHVVALPFNFPIMAHPPHQKARLMLNRPEFRWIGMQRRLIDGPRTFAIQRLMRSFPVILLSKGLMVALLCLQIGLWENGLL